MDPEVAIQPMTTKRHSYGYMHNLLHETLSDLYSIRNEGYYGSHLILTQYQISKGLKFFGEKGEEAVATEL